MAAAAQGSSAQVLLRDTGPRFEPTGVEAVHYDAATHLLLIARRGSVLAADLSKPLQAPQVSAQFLPLPMARCGYPQRLQHQVKPSSSGCSGA